MKNTTRKHLIFLSMIFLAIFGCKNQYEKEAIGYYEVGSYERKDSTDTSKINFPISLTLNSNKTYLLTFKDSTSKGKWKADDYGDWTLVEFFINGLTIQAQLGLNEIDPINPSDFNCPQLKTLVLKKRKKEK